MVYLNQNELDSILAEVTSDLNKAAIEQGQRLAKAKEDGSDDDSSDSSPPSSDSDSGSSDSSGGSAPPAPDASASAGPPDASAGGPPPDASASAPADPAAASPSAPLDVESLKAEYSQLPPEELEMHLVACKAAYAEQQAAAGGVSPDAGAPPAPGASPSPSPSPSPAPPPAAASPSPSPSAPPGPPADQSPPPAMKGEMSAGKQLEVADAKNRNGGLAKSEDVLQLEAKIEEQDKMINGLAKAIELVFQKPQRKAVTSVSFLAKGEQNSNTEITLTRPEILAKLNAKVLDPSLKKSDRQLINSFCVGSVVDVQQIAHLLK
jgi:hypothetical protein